MPTPTDEESRLFSRLISLADSVSPDVDVVETANELVRGCAEFLPVRDAGIMIENEHSQLQVLASTSEETRMLELLELQSMEGPCLEAFSIGVAVAAPDLVRGGHQWPSFRAHALALGFLGAYAVPLCLHGETIGALNLFCTTHDGLDDDEMRTAHRLATMATLGIVNHRVLRRHELLSEQLQRALDVRVVVEQAKGVVAARAGVAMGTAFELLRAAARASRRPLVDVAGDVVQGRLPSTELSTRTTRVRPYPPRQR